MQTKSLAALASAVALVAGPSMVLAQVGPPEDVPPEETPPVTFLQAEATEDPTEEATEEATEEVTEEELEAEQEEVEAEDDGHGELISALAECLPSGAELHGTGITKGFVISQVASTGTFTPYDSEEEPTPVESVEDAELLCEEVQTLADEAEADETAKGRPDWAGPPEGESDTDGDVETQEDGEGGPPEHAGPPADRGGGPPDNAGGGS